MTRELLGRAAVSLVLVGWDDYWPGFLSLLGFKRPEGRSSNLAWVRGGKDANVYVRRGLHLLPHLVLVRILAHEIEHLLEPDFTRNRDHHSALHFCGRTASFLGALSLRHLSPESIRAARYLAIYPAQPVVVKVWRGSKLRPGAGL